MGYDQVITMKRWQLCTGLVIILFARCHHCLDNGLALLPPMGWISTERFQCQVDCVNYPDDCISEKLVQTTADAMVSKGLRDSGYMYVILGDCWMNKTRDASGDLQPDPGRFPGGLQSLVKYVHGKGLKLGVQIDLSNSSSNGYPGSHGNYQRDASLLAKLGIDYVTATAFAYSNINDINTAYKSMGAALNQTGHAMVYGCEWPREIIKQGSQPDYSLISSTCNVYTGAPPMVDSWESLESNIKSLANMAHGVFNYTHPGSWHYPNPILVGDFGLSAHEQYMQLSVWSIMNAPLLVSADLRHIQDYQKAILLHKGTLAIDQDVVFSMGTEITLKGQVHIWRKSVQPKGSFVLLLMYFNISGGPTRVSVILRDIGVYGEEQYQITDVQTGKLLGVYRSWYTLDCLVDPVGALMLKAEAMH